MLRPYQARVPILYGARSRLLHRPRGGTPTRDLPGTRTPDATYGRTRGRARTGAPGGGTRSVARPVQRRECLRGSARNPRGGRCGRDRRAVPSGDRAPHATGRSRGLLAGRTAAGGGAIRDLGAPLGRDGRVAGQDRGDPRRAGAPGESPGGRGDGTPRRA